MKPHPFRPEILRSLHQTTALMTCRICGRWWDDPIHDTIEYETEES